LKLLLKNIGLFKYVSEFKEESYDKIYKLNVAEILLYGEKRL